MTIKYLNNIMKNIYVLNFSNLLILALASSNTYKKKTSLYYFSNSINYYLKTFIILYKNILKK